MFVCKQRARQGAAMGGTGFQLHFLSLMDGYFTAAQMERD